MQKKKLGLVILCLVLLCGCTTSKENINDTEVTTTEESLPISESIVWENITISNITPVTSFEIRGDGLFIFPYNNNNTHITLRKIFISNNGFWDTVVSTVSVDNVIVSDFGYELVTLPNGNTLGYVPIDDESAYLVKTETLPSSYVELVLEQLCNGNI